MKKILPLLLLMFLSLSSNVFAVGSAGFENASFSAESLAQGNAVVAQADEPATISYNPAGILDLKGVQVQSNAIFIGSFTRRSFNKGSMYSSGTLSFAPTGYITVHPAQYLDGRVAFGIGSDSPFGLSNKYDSNQSHVHYNGWKNWLNMYTIKPIVAVKMTNWLSMGAGPVYYRVMDFGGIEAYPNILVAGGLTTDGQIRANLSGNRWGWQYGLLLKPHKKHNVGFYFRSPVTINTRGQIKVENSTSGNFETGANSKIDLPLNFTFGYAFHPSERSTIEADFGYTRWAAYKRSYINNDSVNARENAILIALGIVDKDYSNSYAIHLGGKHKLTDKLELRGGSFFFWSAVPNDHYLPAVPDANRLAFTMGAGYEIFKNITFDIAYLAEFGLRRSIDNSLSEAIGGSVDGKYFSYIQGIYLSLTYKWESLFDELSFSSKKNIELSNSIEV